MISQLTIDFKPTNGGPGLKRRPITASNLHGLLFQTILPPVSTAETAWLHEHEPPKPFALAPLTTGDDLLTGLRIAALTERAAGLLLQGWRHARETEATLRLGSQPFQVGDVSYRSQVDFTSLTMSAPRPKMALRFVTPTAFRQGPGNLPLPVTGNVFARPVEVWQTYAPPTLRLPAEWLAWFQEHVFVHRHHIRTVTTPINKRAYFTGFVGRVEFKALSDDETNLRLWQALGRLAAYCGVGYKTTMGMGAVE